MKLFLWVPLPLSYLMRKWHYSRSIQFHCCRVLARLIYSNGDKAPPRTNDDGAPVDVSCILHCGRSLGRHPRACYDDWCGRGSKRTGTYMGRAQCSSCQRLQASPDAMETIAAVALATRAVAAAVSIIKCGGIETIMAAMKSFPDDEYMQHRGCNAIGNAFYFYYTNPTIDKAMARFVHKLNGIELVVSVMKKFQNNASVQKWGCDVLKQLSKKQALRDALKKGGALSAVGEAAGKHNDDRIQSLANGFFQNMIGKSSAP